MQKHNISSYELKIEAIKELSKRGKNELDKKVEESIKEIKKRCKLLKIFTGLTALETTILAIYQIMRGDSLPEIGITTGSLSFVTTYFAYMAYKSCKELKNYKELINVNY